MGCKFACTKGFMYFINVMFVVCGLVLLIVASLSVTQTNHFKEFLPYKSSLIIVYQGKPKFRIQHSAPFIMIEILAWL